MIFEVTPEHIEALSDEDLRILVGYLSEQEVVRAGNSASSVTYGGHQNAKDGGIDVRVDLGQAPSKGFIPRSQTGFQVKAEDMPNADILAEMRVDGVLRQSIVKLGEAGGAYIIVSSKGSVSDTSLSKRRNAMSSAIGDEPKASGLHLDFYDRRRLATWVNQHPGLIPWVRMRVGLPISGWQPFEDWSSSPGSLDENYITDDHVRLLSVSLKESEGLGATDGINKLREIISKPKGSVRLVGLSGVGKTRLAQALFDNNIGQNPLAPHLAVYTDLADAPNPVPLELLTHLQNLGQRCVMIVDNCGIELHRKLAARMKKSQAPVSILTIEYDISEDEPENTDTFKLDPASGQIIEKIVRRRYPDLSAPEITTIANFSEGNSRIALALAETAQYGESLANLQDSGLIKRLFHQNHQENPDLLRAATICSLVYSFDGETLEGDNAELPLLAALAEQTVSQMHAHVAELHRRQLVQKRSKWRALLPHALAHKLAKQALQNIPAETLKKDFLNLAPERLMKSFSRRIGCLHDSKEAQAIAAQWLGAEGYISDIGNLNPFGITLLDNIAPINPEAVLEAIRASGEKNSALFSEENINKSKIILLLRSLAYDAESFDKAATLITKFSDTGDSSNNAGDAINVFKSLFYIHLSGTHASATQRANFLRNLAQDNNPVNHAFVLAGLDAMLECTHFTSNYGFDFGARKRDYGYWPKDGHDVTTWFDTVFDLVKNLSELSAFNDHVRSMIASQFRFLAERANSTDQLISLADYFASQGEWSAGWAGARTAARLAKKAEHEDSKKYAELADRLKPQSLKERITTYVLPEQWGALDVAELEYEDEKKYEKIQKQVELVCAEIGKELADNPATLATYLPLMLKSRSMRVATVAKAIGEKSLDPQSFWQVIIKEISSPCYDGKIIGFPSSFLSGLATQNKKMANTFLDEVAATPSLHPYFAYMQTSVELDSEGLERMLKVLKSESAPIYSFMALSCGRVCDALSGLDFKRLMLGISAREDGLDVAIQILDMRLFSKNTDKVPLDADDKATGRALLNLATFERKKQRDDHDMARIVRNCLTAPTDESLAENLCNKLLNSIVQFHVSAMDYAEFVTEIGSLFPRVVLNIFVERSEDAIEGRRSIFSGLRERRPCIISKIDDDILINWALEQPETRFLQLAEVIRPWKSIKPDGSNDNAGDDENGPIEWTGLALRLLREAPKPLDILSQYVESFHPSGWGGSLANILAKRLPLLDKLTQNENPAIAKAAELAIVSYKEQIERTRAWEEDRDRSRDERFDW